MAHHQRTSDELLNTNLSNTSDERTVKAIKKNVQNSAQIKNKKVETRKPL